MLSLVSSPMYTAYMAPMAPASKLAQSKVQMMGGKGFGGGEATRDPTPTVYDPNDPKGKQQAIHKAESFAEYLAKRGSGGAGPTVNVPSAFAKKHTGGELRSLNALLQAKEVDFLDRKGKIVATLGPASSSQEMIRKLIAAGVDVFRLNASHRQPGQFEELIPWIRNTAKELGRDVKILGDIQGPKFRCSMTVNDEPVPLAKGEIVDFCLAEHEGDLTTNGRIVLTPTTEQTALCKGLTPGMDLLLDDGFMAVRVVQVVSPTSSKCEVVVGGKLKSRKGINVPQLQIDCSALTVKDREDAKYLLSCDGGKPGERSTLPPCHPATATLPPSATLCHTHSRRPLY